MSEIIETTINRLSVNATDEALLDFIHWIDIEYAKKDNLKQHAIINQIITRAIIALGHCIIENSKLSSTQLSGIKKTIEAASEYVVFPSQQNLDNYFFEATNSFPFGAGEGCYTIRSLVKAEHCGIGTGCRSGAGSLFFHELDNKLVFSTIKENLLPWLNNDFDPVLKREAE